MAILPQSVNISLLSRRETCELGIGLWCWGKATRLLTNVVGYTETHDESHICRKRKQVTLDVGMACWTACGTWDMSTFDPQAGSHMPEGFKPVVLNIWWPKKTYLTMKKQEIEWDSAALEKPTHKTDINNKFNVLFNLFEWLHISVSFQLCQRVETGKRIAF